MTTRRVASLLVTTAASAAVLSGCVYSSEPAPGSPTDPNLYTTEGFPPPGPAPVPGQITPGPVAPPAPPDEPRPATGPEGNRPTPAPETSEAEPRPTGAPAPPPGS